MVSQTDRDNIKKLKNLRQHKMNKTIINIKKAKIVLNETTEKKDNLKQELHSFHNNRLLKHEALFDSLKKRGSVTIQTLMKHKSNNQQLIDDEDELIQKISLIEKLEAEKEEDVTKHQKNLQVLNKKLESLKALESNFFSKK